MKLTHHSLCLSALTLYSATVFAESTRTEDELRRVVTQNDTPPTAELSQPKTSVDQIISELSAEVEGLREDKATQRRNLVSMKRPSQAKAIGSKVVFPFKEGDLYEVRTAVDRITDISLEPGEELVSQPSAGDTVRWSISLLQSQGGRQHVLIKPLEEGIETNLILGTNRRTYYLSLRSGAEYMPVVSFQHEQPPIPLPEQKSDEITADLSKLNFGYELSDTDYDFSPTRVFDDGQKTYLQMPASMVESPVLFVIAEDEAILTNYRVVGATYIVDRLFDEAELRVGKRKYLRITRQSSRCRGFLSCL